MKFIFLLVIFYGTSAYVRQKCRRYVRLSIVRRELSEPNGIISDMTVEELKKVLRSLNLPVSGVKSVLKERIEAAAASKTAFSYGDRTHDTKRDLRDLKAQQYRKGGSPLQTVTMKSKEGGKQDSTKERGKRVEEEKDLWFDDSVFEVAERSSKGSDRRGRIDQETNDREFLKNKYGKAGRSIFEGTMTVPNFKRGENVEATILGFGPLGASVVIHRKGGAGSSYEDENEDEGRGLILQQEVTFWSALNNGQPDIGETLNAYILNVREDGKLDVTLRPVGYDKVLLARELILSTVHQHDGLLPVGPKSSPDVIWKILPGMSKGNFKNAAGKLVNEGVVVIDAKGKALRFVPENERVEAPKLPFSGKSPRGWRAPDGCTIFVANIPFSTDGMMLAEAIEAKIGYGHIAALKLGVDPLTGKSKGFGHIEFFSEIQTEAALEKMNGLRVDSRELRFELPHRNSGGKVRGNGANDRPQSRDWGQSSQFGRRNVSERSLRHSVREKKKNKSWVTVYAGNLAYSVTEESLRYSIEDALGEEGDCVVASVRIAVDRDDPSRKRGFGYVDFFDENTAKMACEKLGGMQVMGRPLKLDYEGPKNRPKDSAMKVDKLHYKQRSSWKTKDTRLARE